MSCHENFSLIHPHAPPTLPSKNSISLLRTPTTIKKPEPEYRKDSEEWSDTALACLLEAYTEKFNQLNRGRDWEEVAEALSERRAGGADEDRGEKQKTGKSVEQCKNKIDNLKKRYKVELQRISGGGGSSHWHWFKQMEAIMGNLGSCSSGRGLEGEDRSGLSNLGKQATKTFEKVGVQTRMQSAFVLPEVAEPYSRSRAIQHLEKGKVVVCLVALGLALGILSLQQTQQQL